VTRLRGGRPRFDFQEGQGRELCLCHGVQTGFGVLLGFCPIGTGGGGGVLLGLRQSRREADH
jgi:hypothetical protein